MSAPEAQGTPPLPPGSLSAVDGHAMGTGTGFLMSIGLINLETSNADIHVTYSILEFCVNYRYNDEIGYVCTYYTGSTPIIYRDTSITSLVVPLHQNGHFV